VREVGDHDDARKIKSWVRRRESLKEVVEEVRSEGSRAKHVVRLASALCYSLMQSMESLMLLTRMIYGCDA
jgi:hypothetical protein